MRVAGVVGAHHHRHGGPGGAFRGRERRGGKRLRDRGQRRLGVPLGVDQAERPVVHLMAAAPPLVGPREGHGAGRAFGKRRAQVHGGDPRLALEALADAVGPGLGQEQRLLAGHVLQAPEVGAQVGFAVQVDVEGAHVEAAHVEVLGRREVHVGHERVRRHGLDVVVELPQEAFDAGVAVPAHDRRRNLVAHGQHQRGRMRGHATRRGHHPLPHLARERGVVEERDVLRPRDADHHAQAVPRGGVEQAFGRHGVGAHRVEAGGGHQREVVVDARQRGKLRALGVGRKGAIGHPAHEEAPAVEFKELSLDAWSRGHVREVSGQHPILSPRLMGRPARAPRSPDVRPDRRPFNGPAAPAVDYAVS